MPSIDIGNIQFAQGDPCRPRYPDFYDLPVGGDIPLQMEPAFQIGDSVSELSIRLDLAPGSVELTPSSDGSRPLCRELNGEGEPDIEYVPGSTSSCIFHWRREVGAPVTRVFRIYCRPKETKPTKEHKVYGGLFLSFTTSPTGEMGREIPFEGTSPNYRDIVLMGSDKDHRPMYDVHKRDRVLPEDIEIEPAFRVREEERLTFTMLMGIEDAQWKAALKFLQPETKPAALHPKFQPTKPGFYELTWYSPAQTCAKPEDCYQGEIVTFHLQPTLPSETKALKSGLAARGWTLDEYRDALEGIGVDPTIILPPPCDPFYQVCYRDLGEPAEPEPTKA